MFSDTLVPRVSTIGRAGLALVAALLLFAGVAELVQLGRPDKASATSSVVQAAGHPDRLTAARSLPARHRDGRVLERVQNAGLRGVRRDRGDTALLHVLVEHGAGVRDCNLIEPRVSVLSQSADAVRLQVAGYEYVPAAAARTGGTTCVRTGETSVPVLLKAPLAGRPVYLGRASEALSVPLQKST
ncbi:hypothetical protein [Jatrophihabitans endophyticus]|uniref:hypothetical protein n=1 Tax=Jatrophihabitans endophyticus TaxID=1206085 RepID=UPI0019E5562E|nr:hypothetical protein [Jatrophihabitans endophyticus]MBE7189293.1 hypothetical protein [Jatrophihabitans endophyticus]